MITYTEYKGYGITYDTITGDTVVDDYGFILETFSRKGQLYGIQLAKDYIDDLTKQ